MCDCTCPTLRKPWIIAVLCCGLALYAVGQSASTNGINATDERIAQLQLRLTEAQSDLVLARSVSGDAAQLPPGATPGEAEEYERLSEMLVRAYQEHLDQAAHLNDTLQRKSDLEQKAEAWTGFLEPAPYSILLVDELRDSVQALSGKLAASESTLNVLASLARDAEANLKSSDAHLRLLVDQLETAKDAARLTRLTWLRTLEQLRNRTYMASVALGDTRRRALEAEQVQDRFHLAFVRRQLMVASQHQRFSQADLDHVLADLESAQRMVDKELDAAESSFRALQRGFSSLREELRLALQNPSQDPARKSGEIARLQAMVELSATQVETGSQRLTVLRRLAEGIIGERSVWQARFGTFHTERLAEIRQGYKRLEKLDQLLRSVKPHFQQRIDLAATRIAEQSNRIQNQPAAQTSPFSSAQELLVCYRQQEALANRALRSLERLDRLALRWKESLDEDRQRLPLSARISDLFSEYSSLASGLWNLELFAAVDTLTVDGQTVTGRRSVTVGKVCTALLILAMGYWLALHFSSLLERLAVKRFQVDPNRASLLRRGVRFVLLVGLVVFSLVSVKIPLTIFAFLGGALAIGLGFGTQTLLKNFVSGVIILFDRPFRIGDVLDLGGSRGVVNSIGIHSSVIRLTDGMETLIPNSELLEKNLTNLTYSDRKVRFTVSVGVAYGSDTRRVAQLLAEEADRHGLVQKAPAAQVIFKDFGDNAMIFELRYWVDVIKHDSSQIGSDLRHMIAGIFAQNNIIFAFPQRDLHLDTVRPLQVRIEPVVQQGEQR
jgi:small-conductance mechanosensitive channel